MVLKTLNDKGLALANLSKEQRLNPVKVNRNGQSIVLTDDQMAELMAELAPTYQLLFGICYFTSCRVTEALQLRRQDIAGERIIFRARTTKTKRTREVKVSARLGKLLQEAELPEKGYLFPGKEPGSHLTRQAADLALRKACDYIGFKGVSTHSFRRGGLTKLYRAGVPLPIIQKRSGHASIANLSLYIDVDRHQVDAAGELL